MSKADLIILVRRRNTHFDFAKIFCSIKCYHLKIKSQFKLGILEHHDIRCHWCEAWFLIFWSICQSSKVGLVGFFKRWTLNNMRLGGTILLIGTVTVDSVDSLSPAWCRFELLSLAACFYLPYLSELDDSVAVAVLHSFNLGVWKSISAITNQIQGVGDESIWIHHTAVNVWM